MKKFIVLILLVILFRIPMATWLGFNAEQKRAAADFAGTVFTTLVEPNCKDVNILVKDGGDGFAYFDVVCDEVPSADPDKPTG